MPRHVPEKKDASNGETRRGAVGERGSGGVRMGKPASRNGDASRKGGEPGEVKHLSTRRKREQK